MRRVVQPGTRHPKSAPSLPSYVTLGPFLQLSSFRSFIGKTEGREDGGEEARRAKETGPGQGLCMKSQPFTKHLPLRVRKWLDALWMLFLYL